MRECGECVACCTVMEIPTLSKPAGVNCPHCAKGCGIYEDRPKECGTYYCLWAEPKAEALNMPEWARPDRIGVIFNSVGPDLNAGKMIAFELWDNAADGYWADKLIKRLRKDFVIGIQRDKSIRRIVRAHGSEWRL